MVVGATFLETISLQGLSSSVLQLRLEGVELLASIPNSGESRRTNRPFSETNRLGSEPLARIKEDAYDSTMSEAEAGDAFEADDRRVKVGNIGVGKARIMQQRDLVDFAVGWLAKNRTPDGCPAKHRT